MKNIEPLVEEMLKDFPETRSSDKQLFLHIWRKEGLKLELDQINWFLTKCSSPESCRRTRQKFQHEGKYLPSEKVQKARKVKAEEMRERFHKLSGMTMHFDNASGIVRFE